MNYFELFKLPVGFSVDAQKLRAAFMDIQRASHPDRFAQSNSYEQEEALEMSAMANKGFTLLNNKDELLAYVLTITGTIVEDEKYALAPDFLMEMMDLNEAWMEADDELTKKLIINKINTLKNEIQQPIEVHLEAISLDSITQEEMLQIKDYYYKKKYLDRILAEFHH